MEGLLRALRQLDAVVATIRAAQDGPAAAAALRSNCQLSVEQVPPRPMPGLCVSGVNSLWSLSMLATTHRAEVLLPSVS